MSPPPLPRPTTWLRKARLLFIVVPLAVALLVVVGGVTYWRLSQRSAGNYERAARARGEPVTLEEVAARYPPIPDADNAAIPLVALWRREEPEFWKAFDENRDESTSKAFPSIPSWGDHPEASKKYPVTAEARGALQEYLRQHSGRLEEVRLALSRPRFRFPIALTNGAFALLPHLSRLKGHAREFQAESLLAAGAGDSAGAIRAIEDAVKVGRLLRDEPLLISQLVRIACEANAVAAMEVLLSHTNLPPPELQRLQVAAGALSGRSGFHVAMLSERATATEIYRNPRQVFRRIGPGDGAAPEVEVEAQKAAMGVRILGWASGGADLRLMYSTYECLLTNAALDSPEKLAAINEAFSVVTNRLNRFPPVLFSGMLLPALQKGAAKFLEAEARRSAVMTALAVEQFREAHGGRLPGDLAELVPAYLEVVPKDPFTDEPLRYRRRELGYVVYSVGSDCVDDGGKGKPRRGAVKSFDVTFTVER